MSAKSYIVKKINELPTFTGALDPNDLVAFFDISTGITHKIKVSEISSGAQGTTDHRDLSEESRFANDQHIVGSVTGLTEKLDQLDAKDNSLQYQIFHIVENSPIDIVRFFMRTQATLFGQLVYLSSETKGTNAAFNITQSITGTNRATANVIAKFAGDTPLTVTRELPAQNTSLFLRLNKNNTNRAVFVYIEFYDCSGTGVLTLKGATSDFEIRNTVDVYNVLLQIEAYIAQIGAVSWIEIKSYQTGSGVAAQTTLGIEGDYYSRFQYRIPAVALSFLDEKLISTQDLPSLNLLAGATQKEVNSAQNEFNLANNTTYISESLTPELLFDRNKIYSPVQVAESIAFTKAATGNKIGTIAEIELIADGVIGHKPTFSSDFNIQFDNWNNLNGVKNLVRCKYLSDTLILTEIRAL